MEKLIDDPKHRNPKLMALRRMIGDYFKENPDARVIVFVKTRELVKAIETYMKETEELRILNPIQFVGVQANKESGGKDKIESMLGENTVKCGVFFIQINKSKGEGWSYSFNEF